MDEKKMNKDEMDGKGSSGRKINGNEPDVLAKFTNIFAGTFLEDFFALKEEDFLDPVLKKEPNEVVISIMSDPEKRVFTLMVYKYQDLCTLSVIFGLDTNSLDELISTDDEKLIELVQESAELQFSSLDQDFPYEVWQKFTIDLDCYTILSDFLNSLVYTRLMPKYFCRAPILRSGFLIVKDSLEVIEDDGTFEDAEKISSQNFPFN